MDITLDKIDKTEALIKVKLKEGDYQPSVEQKIKEYSKKANIKGFRPGKVPNGLIKQLYGKSILAEEINRLLSESLNKYLRESELQFLGEPLPNEKSFESLELDVNQPKEFEFEYNVGFAEEFELKIDSKLKVTKHTIKIDQKIIDETIDNLRRRFGETIEGEVVGSHDQVSGTMTSRDGSINKEINVQLTDLDKGAEKKLMGSKLNETVEIDPKKFYKDSHLLHHQLDISHDDFEQIKGKLSFTIGKIQKTIPAEINQELFDHAFGKDKVKTKEEFQEKIREAISENYHREEEQFFEFELRKFLIDKAKIKLPDEFLKKWLMRSDNKITEEVIGKEYEHYAKDLKWSLIKNKVVKKQEIKAEPEEVVNEAKKMITAQFGQAGLMDQMQDKLEMFAQNYLQAENGENYMKVYNQVVNNKVLDHIKSQITIKEKAVSVDEFRAL